MTTGALLHNYV